MVAPALVPDRLRQAVEGEDLRDGGLGLADDLGEVLLLVAEILHDLVEGLGLLHGGQVLAEQVLDKGDLRGIALGEERGDGLQARELGGLEAPLAGHEVEFAVAALPTEHGFEDAVLLDGGRKLFQGLGVHVLARLVRVVHHLAHFQIVQFSFFVTRCCFHRLASLK
ncbi:MAG: hypothetical protein BWZ01_03214 [Deltaproteobacteria bacterium ADurb.BinA179]|nr:MAG: hypothetical protein BWZ01_03214 [Deltaproteobacteria bacterium ADurb.BinA179]